MHNDYLETGARLGTGLASLIVLRSLIKGGKLSYGGIKHRARKHMRKMK